MSTYPKVSLKCFPHDLFLNPLTIKQHIPLEELKKIYKKAKNNVKLY